MIVSNYGVFATTFTLESCKRYYYFSPAMKGEISQTYSIVVVFILWPSCAIHGIAGDFGNQVWGLR